MTQCTTCDSDQSQGPRRHRCPRNGQEYSRVSTTTIQHHIRTPWQWQPATADYYFCSDPHCEVVYFGQDDSIIEQSALRTRVGLKDPAPDALICYCFGVTRKQSSEPPIKTYVQQQTRQGRCACETRNPAGRCCLGDFPVS